MAPEYRHYIPPDAVEAYEAFVAGLEGAELINKSPIKKDFPQPIESDRTIGELALMVRETLDKLPPETRPQDLYSGSGGVSYGSCEAKRPKKGIPEEWFKLHMGLNHREKNLVSRAMRVLSWNGLSLERAKEANWYILYNLRGEGTMTRELLRKVFSG